MESHKPLISVIVPIYNGEKYIESCVAALLKQSYNNLEIILVDDGSGDSSQNIIDVLKEQDDRIISLSQNNKGVSAARNYGIFNAKGEYIAFVDVDDYVSSEYINYLYYLIERYSSDVSCVPDAQIFYGDVSSIDENLKYHHKEYLWTGKQAAKELLLYNVKMSCWCKLFRKKLLDENIIRFNEKLFCGEGFNFNVDCFLKANTVAVGYMPIYFYRIDNSGSAMTKFNMDLIQNGLEAIQQIEKKIKEFYPDMHKAMYYTKWHTDCDFFNMIVGCGEEENYPKVCIGLKKEIKYLSKYAICGEVSFKEKIKGLFFMMSPVLTAKGINALRPRKFNK